MRGQGGCTHLVSHGASRLAQRCRPDAARRRVRGCTRRCARRHGLFTRDLLLGGRELRLLAQGDQVGGVDLANSTLGAAGSPQKHVDLSAPRNHRANLPLQRRRAAGVANPNPSAVGQHRHRRLLDTLSAAPVTAFAVNRLIIRLVLSHVERGQTGQKATTRTERRAAAGSFSLQVRSFQFSVVGPAARGCSHEHHSCASTTRRRQHRASTHHTSTPPFWFKRFQLHWALAGLRQGSRGSAREIVSEAAGNSFGE
jgi:hypothetical protein